MGPILYIFKAIYSKRVIAFGGAGSYHICIAQAQKIRYHALVSLFH